MGNPCHFYNHQSHFKAETEQSDKFVILELKSNFKVAILDDVIRITSSTIIHHHAFIFLQVMLQGLHQNS